MPRNTAVFMDRDGTINEEVGYLSRLEELKIIPEAFEAIRLINESGMKAVVISNQSGVARGYFGEEFLERVNTRLNEILWEKGARIDAFYYCPHHPSAGEGIYRKACECRKPEPGLLLAAARDMDIDLPRSFMIGDMLKDIEAAKRVGTKGILVRTGYGSNITITDKPAHIADNILGAVKWILNERKKLNRR
mgnify:CR=1 FL=1